MKNIFTVFARSPIEPLEKHANKVLECCNLLPNFVDEVALHNWDKADEIMTKIYEMEREADVLKRDIRLNLPRALFLPVDRTDLLDLVTQLDKLANYVKDISSRIMIRKLCIPKEIENLFKEMIKTALSGIKLVVSVINKMNNLLEVGFKGREVDVIQELINKLDEIEDANETTRLRIREKFFEVEKDYYTVDVMFLYKIIDRVAILAEQSQRVGSRIELLISSR